MPPGDRCVPQGKGAFHGAVLPYTPSILLIGQVWAAGLGQQIPGEWQAQ